MLYTAFLNTVDDVITAAHLREDLPVLDFTMRCSRDASGGGSGMAWAAEIEIPNPGFAPFAVGGNSKYIAFIEVDGSGTPATSWPSGPDATANFANAVVLAKGRVVPLAGDIDKQTLKLQVVCAPTDIQGALFRYMIANLQSKPEFDILYSDMSFDSPSSALEARGATYHIDPATHAISVNDWIDGDRIVNVNDAYDWNSFEMTQGQPPVTRARLKVTLEWTQFARGLTDVKGLFGANGVTTLNPQQMEHQSRNAPGDLVTWNLGGGWTPQRTTWESLTYASFPFATGRVYDIHFNLVSDLNVPNTTGDTSNTNPQVYHQYTDEYATMNTWGYLPLEYWMQYHYEQPRRETVTILVEMPVQDVIGTLAEVDMGEVRLGDLRTFYYPNPNPPPAPDQWGNYILPYTPQLQVQPWSYETEYNTGDIVDFGGFFYQAVRPTSGYFYKLYTGQNGTTGVTLPTLQGKPQADSTPSDWNNIGSGAAIPDSRVPSFSDTTRGKQAILHGILRARAFLRKRLQCRTVTFEGRWEDLSTITMRDQVRLVVYGGPGQPLQPLVGKVTNLERRWSESGRTVRVTIGICLGTGAEGAAPPASVLATYSTIPYFEQGYAVENTESFSGYNDLTYVTSSSPLQVPVDAYQLSNDLYACLNMQILNTADVQMGYALNYASGGRDPRDAPTDYPTSWTINMRPLNAVGMIERYVDVAVTMLTSPRGQDLSTPGGEP
jgi:hypothetical protein